MPCYLYHLPTTAALSFVDLCGSNHSYVRHLAQTTQLRANLRGALKQAKHSDGEKDYLSLVKILDEYIPELRAVMICISQGKIHPEKQPQFSWRVTLSTNVLSTSPRPSYPSFQVEYAYSLLTYAFTLSNFARAIVFSLGDFENDHTISQSDRESKDAQLKHATTHLTRASSVLSYVSETILPEWEYGAKQSGSLSIKKPPDLSREVIAALSKLALADAQSLAIRKHLSKPTFESNFAPGPPLPKSHPAPGLLAKLHIECASLYSSARILAKTPTSSELSSEVSPDLRHYLSDEAALHTALGKKWIAIDAGEKGGVNRAGDAVGFMSWARKDLQELKDGGKSGSMAGIAAGDKEKKERALRKERVARELEITGIWHKHYKKVNDTLHFQPLPAQSDMQSRMPTGILAISPSQYIPPLPSFGPGSLEHACQQAEFISLDSSPNQNDLKPDPGRQSYAGAGDYF
ncbi:hypothetical protein K435DRAFT_748119 [Dendrothele bispora CBS 962.96]|uniref:pH-response regulator protein palC n=1 Tax=Dendrothele bispora (strain CBS 962.96) TaxID=1314807 RepID=A0A4S8MK61_DENBC|nr:hypothetical protein K435DRAFT_748119 [Dendrothele bispora CBS 962.96]